MPVKTFAPPRGLQAAGILAGGVLLLGLMVYLFDRPAGTAMALPRLLEPSQPAAVFGALGGSLPSFAHAYAFALLSCVVLPRRAGWAAAACAFWVLVDSAFEILQWPPFARPAAAVLQGAAWPGFDHLGAYLVQGRFDALDLLAGGLGGGAALLCAHALLLRPRGACPAATDPLPRKDV